MCGLLALLARASRLASAPLEAFLVALAVALSEEEAPRRAVTFLVALALAL